MSNEALNEKSCVHEEADYDEVYSSLHTLKGICLLTHLPRRKIRARMSMG